MNKLRELIFLKQLQGVGTVTINRQFSPLLSRLPDFESLLKYLADPANSHHVTSDSLHTAADKSDRFFTEIVSDSHITAITIFDDEYPSRFNDLGAARPPFILLKGPASRLYNSNIAIIGSRWPSPDGIERGRQLSAALINRTGRTVVSGLATGCDTIGHKTAISLNVPTIALLPCGFNKIYPSLNEPLTRTILEKGGCLLTEYLPSQLPERHYFTDRDRLIAALADGIVVLQCGVNSGTMHTVNVAHDLCRPVGCLSPDTASDFTDTDFFGSGSSTANSVTSSASSDTCSAISDSKSSDPIFSLSGSAPSITDSITPETSSWDGNAFIIDKHIGFSIASSQNLHRFIQLVSENNLHNEQLTFL